MCTYMQHVVCVAVVCVYALCADASTSYAESPFDNIQGPDEYCETETFLADCPDNSVIVMQKARYGRMSLGRCVRKDLGYIGCATDVMPLLDRRCSGRNHCEIRLPDPMLDTTKPCLEELKTYLEASFACLHVLQVNRLACDHRRGVPYVIHEPHGYLSSLTTIESGCGSDDTPYIVQARPGQKVNITVFDFSADYINTHPQSGAHEPCRKYAIIEEKNATEPPVTVCSGSSRVKHIYLSTNHSVQIRILVDQSALSSPQFVIKFEVTGCADYEPPAGMWFRRDEQGGAVGCTGSGDKWRVTCRNKHWQGTIGNCSRGFGVSTIEHAPQSSDSLPFGLSMAIILALAFIVSVVVFFIGIVSFRRCKKLRQSRHVSVPSSVPADIELVDDFGRKIPAPKEPSKSYPQKQRFRTIKTGHNDYAHIWESTIPPGSPHLAQPPPPCGCMEYSVEYSPAISGATICRAAASPHEGGTAGPPPCCGIMAAEHHMPQQQSGGMSRTDLCEADMTYDPPRYYVMDRGESMLADVVFDAERCDVHKADGNTQQHQAQPQPQTTQGIAVPIPEPPTVPPTYSTPTAATATGVTNKGANSVEDLLQHQQQQRIPNGTTT